MMEMSAADMSFGRNFLFSNTLWRFTCIAASLQLSAVFGNYMLIRH